MVRDEYPEVALCANVDNHGFAGGVNQAFARCASPYVLLLNSDTVLAPGVLRGLRDYLDQHERAGVAGPRLLNPDGSLQPSCYHFPTPLHVLLELPDGVPERALVTAAAAAGVVVQGTGDMYGALDPVPALVLSYARGPATVLHEGVHRLAGAAAQVHGAQTAGVTARTAHVPATAADYF